MFLIIFVRCQNCLWAVNHDAILKVVLQDITFLKSHCFLPCFPVCCIKCELSLCLMQASFQRSNSHDKVRKIVAEEGRAARNLIAWSVPLENKEEEG